MCVCIRSNDRYQTFNQLNTINQYIFKESKVVFCIMKETFILLTSFCAEVWEDQPTERKRSLKTFCLQGLSLLSMTIFEDISDMSAIMTKLLILKLLFTETNCDNIIK